MGILGVIIWLIEVINLLGENQSLHSMGLPKWPLSRLLTVRGLGSSPREDLHEEGIQRLPKRYSEAASLFTRYVFGKFWDSSSIWLEVLGQEV